VAERVAKRAYANKTESKIAKRFSQCTARIEDREESPCRSSLRDASIISFLSRILGLYYVNTPYWNMYVNTLESIYRRRNQLLKSI